MIENLLHAKKLADAPYANLHGEVLGCRAWLEGGPVNCLVECLVRWENWVEGEGELRRTVRIEIRDATLGFVNTGTMAWRDPPQSGV